MSDGERKDTAAYAEEFSDTSALSFGSLYRREVTTARAAERPARGAKRRTNLEIRTLNDKGIPYHGEYRMRGRWLSDDYVRLRNAAWAVRNSRLPSGFNPIALRLVLTEAEQLVAAGEPLWDVLEAFAELLTRP